MSENSELDKLIFDPPFDKNNFPDSKGIYLLELELSVTQYIEAGRPGSILFKKGIYTYVGSAFGPGGLRGRLGHHLRPVSKPHWHIDYLKQSASIIKISVFQSNRDYEHKLALELSEKLNIPVPGFGSSDCSCPSHLFYRVKEN